MGKLMYVNRLKTKQAVIIYASKKKDPFLCNIICYYLVDTGAHHKEVFAVRKIPKELIDKYESVADALGAILEKETLDWDLGLTHRAVEKEFFEQLLPEDEELIPIYYPIEIAEQIR